ncbi:cupredoxin domain-containing protein [Bacillus taeanensis]|nr:cupredoxin domain-containing protein [Bacillus taeanensis]
MFKKNSIHLIIVIVFLTLFTTLFLWYKSSPIFSQEMIQQDTSKVHLNIELTEWTITPTKITLNSGEVVELSIINKGSYPHDLVIPELDLNTRTLSPSEEEKITFEADESINIETYCSLPGHKESGMTAQLLIK